MILKAEEISKRYFRKTGRANHFLAVQPTTLALEPGTVTALMGRSGSGKTTLLHMLAGLLRPTEGRVTLDGQSLYDMGDAALSRLRNTRIAVVPQGRSAIDTLSVLENVRLPRAMYGGVDDPQAAMRWLEALDIAALADARPAELSGGELRRMAIARALAQDADVLLADEPTGDLDDDNTRRALQLLRGAAAGGKAVLLVTHEEMAAEYADCVYRMDAGRLSRAASEGT